MAENQKLYFYREPLEKIQEADPYTIYQPSIGIDKHGNENSELFHSQHTNRHYFFKKLDELPQEEITNFLQFQLDKFDGYKSEWIEYVFNILENYPKDTESRIKRKLILEPTTKTEYRFKFIVNKSPKYNEIVNWLKAQSFTTILRYKC